MNRCPQCNEPIKEGNKFCNACGLNLDSQPLVEDTPVPNSGRLNQGLKITIIAVAVVFLLTGGFFCTRYFLNHNQSEEQDKQPVVSIAKQNQVDNAEPYINAIYNSSNPYVEASYALLLGDNFKNINWQVYQDENGQITVCFTGDCLLQPNMTVALDFALNKDLSQNSITRLAINTIEQESIRYPEKYQDLWSDLYAALPQEEVARKTDNSGSTDKNDVTIIYGGSYPVSTYPGNTVSNSGSTMQIGYYILPTSSSEYLTESDLWGLGQNDLMLARNEIYARHGRLFRDDNIQAYFNSMSWYNGYIHPDTFDANAGQYFNKYESANVQLIKNYESKLGY